MRHFVLSVLFLVGESAAQQAAAQSGAQSKPVRDRVPVRDGKDWGAIDNTGKVVVKLRYFKVRSFNDGLAAVHLTENGQAIGFVDKDGKRVGGDYLDAYNFFEGLAAVKKLAPDRSKNANRDLIEYWGFIDKAGKMVIEPQFFQPGVMSEGLVSVYFPEAEGTGGAIGYINKSGKTVVPPRYEEGYAFSEGMACVKPNPGGYGYINAAGKEVVKCQYQKASEFHQGLAAVMKTNVWSFIDKSGKPLGAMSFADAADFTEDGLAAVKDGTKWGYIDKKGKVVIEPEYDYARPFYEGLAAVRKGGKWGYIDKTGAVIIPLQFPDNTVNSMGDACMDFSEGLAAAVSPDAGAVIGGWKYIDKTGKVVIDTGFRKSTYFNGGMATVELLEKNETLFLVIDKTGKELFRGKAY